MAATAAPAPALAREVVDLSEVAEGFLIDELPGGALPPDIAYCLDAELELGGIGGDDRAFVDLFDIGTERWFDALVTDGTAGARRFTDVVRERHAAWRLGALPEDVMTVDWAGIGTLRMRIDDVAYQVMAEMGYGTLSLLGEDATPSEAAVAAHLPDSVEARHFARMAAAIAQRSAADAERWGHEAFRDCAGRLPELYRARSDMLMRRDRAIREAERRRKAEAAAPRSGRERREARRLRDLARRALARSRDLLENLAGRERARAWLAGDTVTVEGRRFDFRLRVADIRSTGHGALDVSVTDKDGIELAALCVYAPDTPALDQISAMVLHVSSGDEDEILRRANVIRASEAGLADAAFREVRQSRLAAEPAFTPEETARREDAARQVGALIAETASWIDRRAPVRRALVRWLVAGALAPLAPVMGGPAGVMALLPPDPGLG